MLQSRQYLPLERFMPLVERKKTLKEFSEALNGSTRLVKAGFGERLGNWKQRRCICYLGSLVVLWQRIGHVPWRTRRQYLCCRSLHCPWWTVSSNIYNNVSLGYIRGLVFDKFSLKKKRKKKEKCRIGKYNVLLSLLYRPGIGCCSI